MQDQSCLDQHGAVACPTVADYVEAWLKDRPELRESSLITYGSWMKNHVAPFFAGVAVSDVTDANARAFVGVLRQRLALSTTRNPLAFLGAVLDEACVDGYLARNPIRSVPRRLKGRRTTVPPRVLVQPEVEALLRAARREGFERPIFATLLLAGLRSGEVRGLEWQNIDFRAAKIRVRQQALRGVLAPLKTPMSSRDVNLDPVLARELQAYAAGVGLQGPEQLVFPIAGQPMRQQMLWWRVKRAAERGGIAHCSVHDLRHTYGSILIAAGADVTYVQRQMGHASPQVTLRAYAGLWDEQQNVDRVSAFLQERFGGAVLA